MFVELHRSRFRLFAKHYSKRYQWAARSIVAVGVLWQLTALLPRRLRHVRDRFHQDRWQSRLRVLALALKGEN